MGFLKKLFGLGQESREAPPRPRAPSHAAPRVPHRAEPPADFSSPITVEYVNYRGEEKTFTADLRSIRTRGTHVSLRLAPTGTRVGLKRNKIGNLTEIEQALEQIVEEEIEQVPAADFSNPVTVEYTNFRGEHKTFMADPKSIRTAGSKHLSMCVAPEGDRITLKRDKIANLSEVEQALRED